MKPISEYLEEDYQKWGTNPYINVFDGHEYRVKSFQQTIEDVWAFSKGLIKGGFKDKNMIIYSENSYEWMVIDLSIMGYVGTCIPVDKEWTAYDMEHVLSSIEVGVIFYSKAKSRVINELREKFSDIVYYCIEEEFRRIIELGQGTPKVEDMESMSKNEMTEKFGQSDMNQTVMIVFTSGTTNISKAIPLTQSNLFSNWDTLYQRTPVNEHDRTYVFLPLNHVLSGISIFLYTIISGTQIYLCYDIKSIVQEMMCVRPTVVCIVPLILKRIYETVVQETNQVKSEAILQMLREIRFLYCGGSFTDYQIKKFFIEQGVALLEGYGMTETSSVISLDRLGDCKIEANGVVLENLDVKIWNPNCEGIGEILVKGGSVSKGYLNSNNDFSEFDKEGYYHTGDLARMDETRHLYLKGRMKRMIITANGKNVYVDELEQLILKNKEIKKVVVYEDNYNITALLVTNLPENEVQDYINEVNSKLPKYKKVKKYCIKEDTDTLGRRIK